ncbi:MAG: sulfur carrier protein [Comamonadaceae bacterium]|nr:MAG: sulfur carrier protein [Comamonadaceae bacterium]
MSTATLKLLINGTPYEFPAHATLADAVARLGIQPPFAAAINLQFIPNTQYPHTPLHEADRIDLIAPVTGG